MRQRIQAGSLAVAAALALSSVASAGAAAARGTPPPLTLTSRGETVRATQGSFCWQGGRTSEGRPVFTCGDYLYPLEVGCRLPVAPGGLLKVRTGAIVRMIDLALIRTADESGADYLDWSVRRRSRVGRRVWRIPLPAEIGSAAAIDVVVNGRRGDSNTWTGLATPACDALPGGGR